MVYQSSMMVGVEGKVVRASSIDPNAICRVRDLAVSFRFPVLAISLKAQVPRITVMCPSVQDATAFRDLVLE